MPVQPPRLFHCVSVLLTLVIGMAAHASGILAPTDVNLPPLRVTDHLVSTRIAGNIARTELTQTFRNDTRQRLEATYVFPLPEQADLTDFQMTFNGKMVKGEVLPAEQARQIYESIVRQSRDPGLIEFIGSRLLRMRVFPIEPNSDTTIKLSYQQICRPVSGMMGYHYPLRTAKTGGRAYGNLRFSIDLQTEAPLKGIWSPTHNVEIVRDGEYDAKIAYEVAANAAGASLEEDFILLYDTDASDLGLSLVAHKQREDEPGHFVLMLTPKQLWPKQSRQPQDVVFVLDTSGSMAGEKIEQAKKSLRFCIDQLNDQDRFTVVRFSTGFDVYNDGMVVAAREARTGAQQWVDQFEPAGGTNICDTLARVMGLLKNRAAAGPEQSDAAQRPFVVIFLTDGQGNREPDEIMQALAGAAPDDASLLRIFPFGVGHDVNTRLLDSLSEDYAGRPTYVHPGEDLELVLSDFFSIISRPVLTNLALSLPDVNAMEKFPVTLGDLYHGQQLVVAGQFARETVGPVTLTAVRGGERVEYTWPDIAFTSTEQATYVPSVWAGRKIAYLLDEIRRHGENEEMIAEVVALAQHHGIQTPYTSWLVNPENTTIVRHRFRSVPGSMAFPPRWSEGRQEAGSLLADRASEATFDGPELNLNGAVGAPDYVDGIDDGRGDLFADSGTAAVHFAARNAQMKEAVTTEGGRLNRQRLAARQFDGVWYHQISGVLVDARFDADDQITIINFGSPAYFELLTARPALKRLFSAQKHVLAVLEPGEAILIANSGGIDEISAEHREQLGLEVR